jgi:hypothetical protein
MLSVKRSLKKEAAMFNIFDELKIGMAAKEKQDRFGREAALRRLLNEAQAQHREAQGERTSWTQFLALAFKALGTNGQMNWKL